MDITEAAALPIFLVIGSKLLRELDLYWRGAHWALHPQPFKKVRGLKVSEVNNINVFDSNLMWLSTVKTARGSTRRNLEIRLKKF